jgi:hypothetical protein
MTGVAVMNIFLSGCGQTNNAALKSVTIKTEIIKVGNSPGSVEVADFNNDKIPDIAVTSETDSSVTVLLGNGKDGFTKAYDSLFFAGPNPNDIAIADFNNDGNMDLAFANHEQKYFTVLLGAGNGSFSLAKNSPFAVESIPHVHGLAIGDFNHDGRTDIVTDSWGNDQVVVIFGDSLTLFKAQGVFFKVGKRPYQRVRAADINKDGFTDIVTTNAESNNTSVLFADGKGGFTEAAGSPFSCGDAPFGLAIGDVNADGNPDLAIINSPGSMAEGKGKNGLTVLLGDGTGDFLMLKGSPFEAGNIPNRIAIGDVNGDGVKDIVVSDNSSDRIYFFMMSKQGFALQTTVKVGYHPKGIAVADLNGNGNAEIVVCNQQDNAIIIISTN